MSDPARELASKVPQVTLGFWVIKILATTVGETGGDAVSMSLDLGYLIGTAIFAVAFIAAVAVQMRAKVFHPLVYWTTIVASTTVGTTLADFATRSLGIGYVGGSALLLALLALALATWHRRLGSVAIDTVASPQSEAYYWTTIMLSQTLGTALGDWTADSTGLGYNGGIALFGTALVALAIAWRWSRASHVVLFWAAFILTRPFGAVVGDFLDKPLARGGLDFSRFSATAVLLLLIALAIAVFPQRAASQRA